MFQQKSLKSFCTFGIGGIGWIAQPTTSEEFLHLFADNPTALIIGGGSNIVFSDGECKRKIIVTRKLNTIEKKTDYIGADMGVSLSNVFPPAAGVPATVGGALCQNFGAFEKTIGNYVIEVDCIDREGKRIILSQNDCQFGYRASRMKKEDMVVTGARLKPFQGETCQTYLTQRKTKQPIGLKNAGSVFKNPQGDFAGRLIEHAGCKGMSCGDIVVWQSHANFFINRGEGTCEQLRTLIDQVTKRVFDATGVMLECEIELV